MINTLTLFKILVLSFLLFSVNKVFAQPSNDNPCTAIPLTSAAVCNFTSYTNANATSSVTAPGCANYSGGDVWFSVVVPTSGQVTINTNTGVITDGGMAIYSGTCGSLTLIECDDNDSPNGLMPSINYSGTIGNTIFIQIWENGNDNNGTFSICAQTIIPNCSDGIMNQNESGIDCGGVCPSCPTPTAQDCDGAIPICQNTYSESTAYLGTGNYPNEISNANSCLPLGEQNDAWYTFSVVNSGNLCFTIAPNTTTDNFDWGVYNVTTSGCPDIFSDASLEISCNSSGISGDTGPNGNAGSQNEPCIAVTNGERYVVNVSQLGTSTAGYTLNFSTSTASIIDNVPPEIDLINQPIACGSTSLSFNFSENILCSSIQNGDFQLNGPDGPYTLSGISGSNCASGGTQDEEFTINVSPPITTSGNYQLCLTNADGSVTDLCNNTALPSCFDFSINNGIVANAGNDQSMCDGGTAVNLGGGPSAIGGTAPLTYSWTPTTGLNNSNIANPVASPTATTTYTLTVTDANGCQAEDQVTITVTPAPIVTVNSGTICPGESFLLTASGASTYTWSPSTGLSGTTGASITSTPPSTQIYTVTGSIPGCPNSTANATVTVYPVITPNFSITGNQCLVTNSITLTNTGTIGTYNWTFAGGTPATGAGSPITTTFTTSGLHNITLTTTLGACTNSKTIPVTINTEPTVAVTPSPALCNGDCSGSIIAVAAGTSGYSYNWGGGVSGASLSGQCAGPYSVTVTDINGCQATGTGTITAPSALQASAIAGTINCNGGTTTVTITATGGTAPYSGTGTFTTSAGNYSYTVTDANLCTSTVTGTITEPTVLNATATPGTISCNGGTTSVVVSANGGTAAYSGTGSFVVSSGAYSYTVTDVNTCSSTVTGIVTEPTPLSLSIVTQTNVLCNGASTGSVTIGASGSSGSYNFNIGNGNQTSGTFTNLDAGSYTITVSDATNPVCSETINFTITEPAALTATIGAVSVDCNGDCDGQVTVIPGGGSGLYTYAWNNTTFDATATTLANLCANSYNVTIADAASPTCTVTASINVTEPTAITLVPSSSPANCGISDGTASVIVSGGSGTYSNYQWTPAPGSGQGTALASGLAGGLHSVVVTDSDFCTETILVNVASNTAPTITEVVTNHIDVTCNGATNGVSEISASGGTGTLNYSWAPSGGTATVASGLGAGTYAVTVTDANSCTDAVTITITEPSLLNAVANTTTNATCNGASNGTANVNVSGGTLPYSYQWYDSSNTPIIGGTLAPISGLAAGNYYVIITDDNSCVVTSNTITISQPAAVSGAGIGYAALCNGGNTGSIDLTPAGGDANYTYAWTGPSGFTSNIQDPLGLEAGTYDVTITDGASCTGTTIITVTEPTILTISASGNDAHCGLSDGDASAVGNNGSGTLTYEWFSNAGLSASLATGENIGTLSSGTYYVQVTDANGCQSSTSVIIGDLAGPTLSAFVNANASGYGLCNGSATAAASGGTGVLTYSWGNGNTNITANNLCQGINCVTVTDASGCIATSCISITEPDAITVDIIGTNLDCNGICIGEADLTASGGVGGYVYAWSHGPTAADLTGLCAGTYNVTVTDINGNTGIGSVTITEPTLINITSSVGIDANCFGDCNGSVSSTAINGTAPLTYEWFYGATSIGTTASISNLCAGTYNIIITDDNGCTLTSSATVDQPADIILSTTVTNSNCGQADGAVNVTALGGTTASDYSYSWSNATPSLIGTTANITNLLAGTYTITTTDDNGCIANGTATILDLDGATLSESHINTNCNASSDASINLTVTGGNTPFTYAWTGPVGFTSTMQDLNGLVAGTYDVTVTDAVNCIETLSIVITEPALFEPTTTSTQATCFGEATGEVNITSIGGTGAITFNWFDDAVLGNNIGTGSNVSNLEAGIYYVSSTDANGCLVNSSVTVQEPAQIVVTPSSQTANCSQSDGSISVTSITGGSGVYTSTIWVDASNNLVLNNNTVASGTYTVTVTDDQGCTGTANVGVNDLIGPSVSLVSASSVTCEGNCNGTASISVSGGTSGYTYSWAPTPGTGQGTNYVTGLCEGDYTATVTDVNGCIDNILITIVEPAPLEITIATINDATINGLSNGSITTNTTGGTPSYSYDWYTDCPPGTIIGQTNADVSAMPAGDYSVIVTDAKGCSDTACATINEPTAISAVEAITNTTCFNGCNGQISVAAAGGVPGYTYNWFDATNNTIGQNGNIATNLCAGDYYVVIIDQNGALFTSNNFTVGQPLPISIVTSVVSDFNGSDISCIGMCDGIANVAASGGTSPYTFDWGAAAGNQTTANANNLCDGTFNVVVTDNYGCTENQSITLVEPSQLSNTPSQQDVTCHAACDGSATATPAGGTGNYSYQWNDPTLSTTASVANLCANTYDLTITDDNGCAINGNYTITQPAALVLSSSSKGSNCGQDNGNAIVTVVSGVAPYTYTWDTNAGSVTTATANNLNAGCYDVIVTDANGCDELLNICVQDLGAPSVTLLTHTNVDCFGGNNGFAQIQITNGIAPYTYTWSDCAGNTINQSTASAFNLTAGCYTGSMVDNVGCTGSISVTITEPTILNSAITNSNDVSCFGFCDGSATVTAGGGTAPYTYQWNDVNNQTTATATGLCPGTYSVEVLDAHLCIQTLNITINEPNQITLSASAVGAFCNTPSGSATVNITGGGIGSLTYLWTPGGQTTQTATNVTPGIYNVQVTDADGCTQNSVAAVSNILASTATIGTINNVSCNGGVDGEIDVSMSGTGTAPFSFQWYTNSGSVLTGQTNSLASGLIAGDYYVEVTDVNGCVSISNTDNIVEPTPLNVIVNESPILCHGDCSGEAQAFPSGGTTPYNYAWNDALNQTTDLANSLCSQLYNVTITDNQGCTTVGQINISEPTAILLDSSVTNANCGLADGSGCVNAIGGTAPYTYLWPDGATSPCHTDLLAGSYLVTVTDAHGCIKTIVVEIQDLSGPSATISSSANALCFGDCNGSALVAMTGGNGTSFSVLWDANTMNQTTPTASNLCEGIYTVIITDNIGCIASTSITITEPAAIQHNVNLTQNSCFNACDGEAEIIVVGGTLPYSYNWINAANTSIGTGNTVNALCAASYGVNITDDNGCIANENFMITQPIQVTGTTTVTDVNCFGTCDGIATGIGADGVAPYTFTWDAGTGNQTGVSALSLCPGTYNVVITDANGCIGNSQATITEPTQLTADINLAGNVTCNNVCNGFAQVIANGGTPGYQYSWSGSSGSNAVATALCAGSYTITVTDAKGCTATDVTTLTQPQPLTASSSVSNLSCFQTCDGDGSVSPSGGTAPYTFQWNNSTFATTSSFSNECAGIYSCVITDANNCKTTKIINITQPNTLQISANLTPSNCGQGNGQICTNTNGGTAPYTFQWNDPNTQTGACALSLDANCYSFTVTDANACVSDTILCINDIAGPIVSNVSFADVTCFGATNGTVEFSVSGGAGTINTEIIDQNNLNINTGSTLATNLDGGCYTLIAEDAAGCVATNQQCIFEPNILNSAVIQSSDALCNATANGTANVAANGGVTPYTFLWNGGTSPNNAANSGMAAGNYTVIVTDANGCSSQSSILINEPAPLDITEVITNISCFGVDNGSINLTVTGGSPFYLYNWSPNIGSGSTIGQLTDGNYSVLITDANGCTYSESYTIIEPAALIPSFTSIIDPTCEQCNGEMTISTTGGSTGNSYLWSSGTTPTTAANSGLCAGLQSVIVTDGSGCTVTLSHTLINQASPVIDSIIVSAPTCLGTATGSATVYGSSSEFGTGNLTYAWDANANNQNVMTAVALEDGNYCVTIKDQNGCIASSCAPVIDPNRLIGIPDGSSTICHGEDVHIWASGQGGTAPYSLTWTDPTFNGITDTIISPLVTTDYCFRIKDANSCFSADTCIEIQVKAPLSIDLTPSTFVCTDEDIDLIATASGGDTAGYSFDWIDKNNNIISDIENGNESNVTINPSIATWYYVTLNDGCSISAIDSTEITISPKPIAFFSASDSNGCEPFSTLFIGGSDIGATYEFDIDCDGVNEYSGPNTNFNYTFTEDGLYDICMNVISTTGCVTLVSSPSLIEVYPLPIANFTPTPAKTTFLTPYIIFTDSSTGGTLYNWNFGDNNSMTGGLNTNYDNENYTDGPIIQPTHTFNDIGYYDVVLTIETEHGCFSSHSETIFIETDYSLYTPNAFTPNGDGVNDTFKPLGIGIDPNNYEFLIFNRWGQLIFESSNIDEKWDGSYQNVLSKQDVYVWTLKTRDPKGVPKEYQGHVTLVR